MPMSTARQVVVGPKERSSHPGSAFLDDGMDEDSVEVLEEAGHHGGLASVESLNLLQLELSEEDQPTVVPYEEVGVGSTCGGGWWGRAGEAIVAALS